MINFFKKNLYKLLLTVEVKDKLVYCELHIYAMLQMKVKIVSCELHIYVMLQMKMNEQDIICCSTKMWLNKQSHDLNQKPKRN